MVVAADLCMFSIKCYVLSVPNMGQEVDCCCAHTTPPVQDMYMYVVLTAGVARHGAADRYRLPSDGCRHYSPDLTKRGRHQCHNNECSDSHLGDGGNCDAEWQNGAECRQRHDAHCEVRAWCGDLQPHFGPQAGCTAGIDLRELGLGVSWADTLCRGSGP